jgi:hypothetical protein
MLSNAYFDHRASWWRIFDLMSDHGRVGRCIFAPHDLRGRREHGIDELASKGPATFQHLVLHRIRHEIALPHSADHVILGNFAWHCLGIMFYALSGRFPLDLACLCARPFSSETEAAACRARLSGLWPEALSTKLHLPHG